MTDSTTLASGRRLWWVGWLLGAAVLIGLGFVTQVGIALAGLPPLPGRAQADGVTGLVSIVGDFVARLSTLATLGLLTAALGTPRTANNGKLGDAEHRLTGWAARVAQVWFAASLLMTFANSAFVNGVPMGYTYSPATWWTFQSSTPSGLAWLTSALVALAVTVALFVSRQVSALVICWLAGVISLTFVAVTGNVSVGLDHDAATDATIVGTLALIPLLTLGLGNLARWLAGDPGEVEGVRRYQRVALPTLLVVAAAQALISWQELAGQSPLAVAYGVTVVGAFGCLALLLVSWVWRAARGIGGSSTSTGHRPGGVSFVVEAVLTVAWVALLAAANHLPPPRFALPQSIQVNYLGYEVDLPATVERLAGFGRPNLLWAVLCVAAIAAYVWGMVKVARLNGRWPYPRLIAWVGGWAVTLYLATSGLWMYSTALYSWHMLVHMTVNMLVPILCVLGAPFGLIVAASRPRLPDEAPGPGELLRLVGSYRPVRVLLSPPVLWIVYVGSLFAVYFSPLFPWLMRYHWAHQLMLLYFMATGFAFFSMIVGVDRHTWRLPYLIRYALLMSVMPFHALFAVGIMMSASLIGADFYRAIAIPWVGDLMADQNVAGQITWFTGEIPIFIAVLAVAAQWFREDRQEAARSDALIGGEDDPMDAYNELLARLADHDRELKRQEAIERIRGAQ